MKYLSLFDGKIALIMNVETEENNLTNVSDKKLRGVE